jgi:hypothetical protein
MGRKLFGASKPIIASTELSWNRRRLIQIQFSDHTRLSAGGVADEWVTQLLRQTDAQVFKKYSQMKLQMMREALAKMDRHANEGPRGY